MTKGIELTKLRLSEGIWQGALTSSDPDWTPELRVTHLDETVEGVTLVHDRVEEHWLVSVPIPVECISDGVQTFVIRDAKVDHVLGSFTIVAGDALAEDIRAEMSLLRAELDMLKKAFRRHCVETMG